MTIRAYFRGAEYVITADNVSSIDASTNVMSKNFGQTTPNNGIWTSEIARIDSTTQEVATPTIASLATYNVALTSITTTSRVLIRVTSTNSFAIAHTSEAPTLVSSFNIAGSSLFPAVFECVFDSCHALAITNMELTSGIFNIQVINIVEYDDPSIGASLYPPTPVATANYNATVPPGLMPLGTVIPIMAPYSAANNTGTYRTDLIFPISGFIGASNWMQKCDGTQILDASSPLYLFYVPKIDDERFIMGVARTNVLEGAVSLATIGGNYRNFSHTHSYAHTHTTPITATVITVNASLNFYTKTYTTTATTGPCTIGTNVSVAQHGQHYHDADHFHTFGHTHVWGYETGGDSNLYGSLTNNPDSTNTPDIAFLMTTTPGGTFGASLYDVRSFGGHSWFTTGVTGVSSGTHGGEAIPATLGTNAWAETSTAHITNAAGTTPTYHGKVDRPDISNCGFFTSNSYDDFGNTRSNTWSTHSVTQPTFSFDYHIHSVDVYGGDIVTMGGQASYNTPAMTTDSQSATTTSDGTWTNSYFDAHKASLDIRPQWIGASYWMRIK